jgi:hypothetical protein
MNEKSAHARNHDLSAAAEIFANGTCFPNTLRVIIALSSPFFKKPIFMRFLNKNCVVCNVTHYSRQKLNSVGTVVM